jgi:hypothetical protein
MSPRGKKSFKIKERTLNLRGTEGNLYIIVCLAGSKNSMAAIIG